MKKSDCLLVLAALPKNEIIRIIIDLPNYCVDINRSVVMAIDWFTHEFSSPCDDNGAELSCIELVVEKFDTRPNLKTWELYVWYFDLLAVQQNYRRLSHFDSFEKFAEFVQKLRQNKDMCDIRIMNLP